MPDPGRPSHQTSHVLVACWIRRSAFSGERVVRIPMAAGHGCYVGIAPLGYCLDRERIGLHRDEPACGETIDGYVKATLVGGLTDDARVSLPDGEVISVPASRVAYRIEATETKWVPITR